MAEAVEKNGFANKIKTGVVCTALAGALAVGGVLAYLTAVTPATENKFNLDTNIAIELEEANWNADAAKGMTPSQTVAKDPKINNTGTVSAYIAATVKVPIFDGEILVEQDGVMKKQNVTNHDLFSYTVNEGWAQYGEPVVADGYRTYTYVFANPIAGAASTANIFDDVTLANLTGDVGVTDTNIDVTAFAIQSQGFDSATAAYDAYKTQAAAAVIAG